MGRGKPTGPRQRPPIDVVQHLAARHCDRCKRRPGVLIQVNDPFGYVCPECLEAEDPETRPRQD